MPVYNRTSYLDEAIKSVLNQTYRNYEFIIVDDGSTTDKVREIVSCYPEIKYYKQQNKGISAARNKGIDLSNGEYIAFIDDDDVWLHDKLEKQINFLNNNKDKSIGILSTWFYVINEYGQITCKKGNIVEGKIGDMILLNGNIVNPPSSVVIKRECISTVGGFNEDLIGVEDMDLWYRISQCYEVYSLNEFLIKYRVHQDNISRNVSKIEKNERKFLEMTLATNEASEGYNTAIYLEFLYRMLDAYYSVSDLSACRIKIKEILQLDKSFLKRKQFLKYCFFSYAFTEKTFLLLKKVYKHFKHSTNTVGIDINDTRKLGRNRI